MEPGIIAGFSPSEYCGGSGYATPDAHVIEHTELFEELVYFHIEIDLPSESE